MISVNPGNHTARRVQHYQPAAIPNECSIFDHQCEGCCNSMQEPYIECAECRQLFCLPCFASGFETASHRNNHAYIIRNDNIHLFKNSTWNARDEKRLLDALLKHGHGNWDEIAKTMQTQSADECEQHYHNHYFDGIFEKTMGITSEPYFPIHIPYLYKMKSLEPPRNDVDSSNFNAMAGYRCARGDFDVPYDNSAESIVSNLDLSWEGDFEEIGKQLNESIFNAYNHRMR